MPEPTVREVSDRLDQLRVELKPVIESANAVAVIPAASDTGGGDARPQDPRKQYEQRIAVAPVKDLPALIKGKRDWDILVQEEARKKTDNDLKRLRAIAKISMPFVGVGTGLLLLFTGFGLIGAVAVGAGLGLGPALIEKIMDRIPGGGP